MAVAALSTAGPEVVMHTPTRPVTRLNPSAAKAAPCSWRGLRWRMPASPSPAYSSRLCVPGMPQTTSTPWAARARATARPPVVVRGAMLTRGGRPRADELRARVEERGRGAVHDLPRRHGDARPAGQAELAARADQDPAAHEQVGQLAVVDAELGEHEVGRRVDRRHPAGRQRGGQALAGLDGQRAPRGDLARPPETGHPGGQRGAVDVERLLHAVQVVHELGIGEQVAEPQPGQAEDLRERPQDDDGPPVGDVVLTAQALARPDVVDVRLVGHDDAVRADGVQEPAPLARLQAQAGRVVGIADPDHARARPRHGGGDALEVEARGGRGGGDALHRRAGHTAGLGVEAIRGRGHDDTVARADERADQRVDQRLDPVAGEHLLGPRAGLSGQRVAQRVVGVLGIGPGLLQRVGRRLEHAGQRAPQALVPVELVDGLEAVPGHQVVEARTRAVGADLAQRRAQEPVPAAHQAGLPGAVRAALGTPSCSAANSTRRACMRSGDVQR